jgi:hypothetical protein
MKTIHSEFRVPAVMAMMFACLSVAATAATTVMPLVI